MLKGEFWVNSPKKIACSDFLKRLQYSLCDFRKYFHQMSQRILHTFQNKIKVNDSNIFYELVSGGNHPILLLPGALGKHKSFTFFINFL